MTVASSSAPTTAGVRKQRQGRGARCRGAPAAGAVGCSPATLSAAAQWEAHHFDQHQDRHCHKSKLLRYCSCNGTATFSRLRHAGGVDPACMECQFLRGMGWGPAVEKGHGTVHGQAALCCGKWVAGRQQTCAGPGAIKVGPGLFASGGGLFSDKARPAGRIPPCHLFSAMHGGQAVTSVAPRPAATALQWLQRLQGPGSTAHACKLPRRQLAARSARRSGGTGARRRCCCRCRRQTCSCTCCRPRRALQRPRRPLSRHLGCCVLERRGRLLQLRLTRYCGSGVALLPGLPVGLKKQRRAASEWLVPIRITQQYAAF
jgi:hypothetical protein